MTMIGHRALLALLLGLPSAADQRSITRRGYIRRGSQLPDNAAAKVACRMATTGKYLHARPTDSSARYLGI